MDKEQLKFVLIDDLIEEILDRNDSCVIAYTKTEDPKAPNVYVAWSENTHIERLGLCKLLENELIKHFEEQNKK